jgi:hypothetical protein
MIPAACASLRTPEGIPVNTAPISVNRELSQLETLVFKPVPPEFSKPEVIAIPKQYYDSLEEKGETKRDGVASGETAKPSNTSKKST